MNCKHGLGALEDKNRAEVKQAREFIVEPYKKKNPAYISAMFKQEFHFSFSVNSR